MSFRWLGNCSKSDLTVQHVFCTACLNESTGRGSGGWGFRTKRVDGAFPQESLQSVSCCDIRQSTLSALKDSSALNFRSRLTQSPMFPIRSTHYPKCGRALRVKRQQAASPQPIISSLSGLAKQGDSFFFFFKPSCSSNSEGVGKPFLLKKGWKQKHKSANIKKQCQMNIVCFVVVVLFMFCFTCGDREIS